MGRRSEPRTSISFPVLVRGFDSRGTPFSVSTETFDVSCSGASIKGLESLVQPGNKIEIEFKDQKAWYRVQWVGKDGSSKAGRVGVRCLERKYMWDVPAISWEKDPYGEVSSLKTLWDGEERRLFRRRSCRIEAQVSIPGSSVRLPGKVTDISLGGCYVEMLAPLPIDTAVELVLSTGDIVLRVSGKVRSSQLGMGMGVAFTFLGPGEFEKLRRLAPSASGTGTGAAVDPNASPFEAPQSRPQHFPSHAAPNAMSGKRPTTAEVLESVIRALLRKNLLSQEDVVRELEGLKTNKQDSA